MPENQHQFPSRTKRRALDVLLDRLEAQRPNIEDCAASEILTNVLATDILETAWKHQFDDDRSECRNKVHELVEIAIEDWTVEVQDADTSP